MAEDVRGASEDAPPGEGSDLPFGPTSLRRPAQYRVKVRERNGFDDLRMENVDPRGQIQSVVGYRDGRWHTVTLLVDKNAAHIEEGRLVADEDEVQDTLLALGGEPVHVADDCFVAPGLAKRRRVPVIGAEDDEAIDDRVQRVV